MKSIFEVRMFLGLHCRLSKTLNCRSAFATSVVTILSLVGTFGILSAEAEVNSKAPFDSPPVVSVAKPARKSERPAPDPASRQAVSHRVLGKGASTADISLFTGFPEPLKPVGEAAEDTTTSALVTVINRWAVREKGDDFSLLEDFIRKFPSSTWAPALRFNLAKLYHGAGYFTKAIETYQGSRSLQSSLESVQAVRYQSLVVAELAGLYARTGRQQELAALLEGEKNRVFSDYAKIRLDQAREGLSTMVSQPEIAFRCGTYALANVARTMGRKVPDDFLESNASTPDGFTLAQLNKFAREQLELPMSAVKRSVGQPIPFPSVIHLRCGHYAALLSRTEDLYQLRDPTFGPDIWVTARMIEDEGSGFFIVPEERSDGNHPKISEAEAAGIAGKGWVATIDPKATKKCDKCTDKCQKKGMADYRIHLLAASLSVTDMPLVIPTAYGPGLALELTYNQREYEPSSTKLYTHFGPQWVSGMVSWLSGSGAVTIYLPGGGSEIHSGFTSTDVNDANQGYYGLERQSQTRLYRTGPTRYELRSMDGSKMVYERAIIGGQIFLSQIMDPWGNALTYSYNDDIIYPARISKITAASGQSLHLFYGETDPYLVIAAADEADRALTFRKASFGYANSGPEGNPVRRLETITDPLGIVSKFQYNNTGFMNKLTTPYGDSSFATGESSPEPLSSIPLRWLEATDAQGAKERVEFVTDVVDSNTISASPLPGGTNITTAPENRRYRNTFYWSKKAWATAPNDRSKAHLYHWLHAPDATGAFGVLEMEKAPFENNIWYNYAGQNGSMVAGLSASPSTVSQAIEKHDGTVMTLAERYVYHPLTGNLTKKRVEWPFYGYEYSYDYDPTGYELLQVRVANGFSTVQGFSNYLKRQPKTITDAQGQNTLVAYHAVTGQVETVTNALLEVTTYSYETDPAKNGYRMVLSITGPQPGAATTFTYDTADRLKTATDSSGRTLTYSYDAFDRVTLIQYPDTTSEQFVYANLDLFARKDRQNRWTRTWHNAIREPIVTADALGRTTRFEWCRCGALQKLTDANGRTTSWVYDAQGRNTQKTYPDGRTEATTYQPLSGRVSTTTDAAGQIKTMTYHGDGSLRSNSYSNLASTTAATPSVSYAPSPSFPGHLVNISDGTGSTSFSYYPAGVLGGMMLKTVDGPLAGTSDLITYTYDALGRTKTTNIGPNGVENLTTWNYDSLNRLQSVVNPLGNPTGTFTHHPVGVTDRTDSVTYPNGQKTSFGYFGSNKENRLQTITHFRDGATPPTVLSKFDYTHLPEGNISTWQRQFATDPATIFNLGYDSVDQLTSATLTLVNPPATVSERYSYQYDPAGNRTSAQQGNLVNTAVYNSANRVTGFVGGGKVLVSGATNEPAAVKVNGQSAITTASNNLYEAWVNVNPGPNILTVEATDFASPPLTTTKKWSVNITGGATRSYDYDGNGNTLSDGLRTYRWDAENRLVKITQGANVYEFIYDGMFRRVAEKLNGTLTKRWVWNGSQIAEQRNGAGDTVQRQYYSEGEKRIGGPDNGNYYYTRDHLGSIREMTDSTAKVRARYDYNPYGVKTSLTAGIAEPDRLDCEFGFTGHYFHVGSNLHLTLYRAYDQEIGRWLSADPIGEKGGLNLYGYVGNNPANAWDPYGLSEDCLVLSGGASLAGYGPIGAAIGLFAADVYLAYEAGNAFREMREAQQAAAGAALAAEAMEEEFRRLQENLSRGHNNLPRSPGDAREELARLTAEKAGMGNCPGGPEGPKWKKKLNELKLRMKALEKYIGGRGNSQK